MALVRLALIRLTRRPILALAQLTAFAGALALAAGFQLVGAAAQEVGFHAAFEQFAFKRFVNIETPGVRDAAAYGQFQQLVASRVHDQVGDLLPPGERYAATGEFQARTLNGIQLDLSVPRPTLATVDGLERHAVLAAGSWPQAGPGPGQKEYPAAVSQRGADLLDVKPGDQLCVGTPAGAFGTMAPKLICFRITGVWTPRSASDPFWGVSLPTTQLQLAGADFFAVAADLTGTGATFRAGAVFAPDGSRLHATDVPRLRSGLKELRGEFLVRRDGQFASGLDRALDALQQRADAAAFTVQLVGVQLLLVALYFVAFATAHVLDQHRDVFATWRARGWGWNHLFALLSIELASLALTAVPIGIALAWATASVLSAGLFGTSLSPSLVDLENSCRPIALAYGVAVAVALGQALALSRRPVSESRRRARADAHPWWRRRGVDLLLAGLALPVLLELRLRGSAGTRLAEGPDPVGLVLPAAALGLLALASLRLLAPLAALLARTRPVGSVLAGWQIARRPWTHAQLALLLAFTVAIGLFAGVYSSTEARNAADRVAYANGGDLRFQLSQSSTPVDIATVLDGLGGIGSATELYRTTATPGSSIQQTTVLAVDPGTLREVAWTRPDLGPTPIAGLLGDLGRADRSGVPLPSGARNLSIWINSTGLSGTVAAELATADGGKLSVPLGNLGQTGWRQLAADLATDAPAPRRLVDLVFRAAGRGVTDGTVLVSDLAADGVILQDFTTRAGWWRWPVPTFSDSALAPVPKAGRDGRTASALELHLGSGRAWLRPAPAAEPVPALVSSGTLDRFGVGLGQPFTLRVDSRAIPVVAVGRVAYFPTVYPQLEDFMLVAREPLLARLARDGDPGALPNEAWLRMAPTAAAQAATALSQRGDVVQLGDRAADLQAIQRDPLRLELTANLLLGFAASLTLAALAFGLHTLVSAQGRLAEYAILRANGLSPAQVDRSLLIEDGLLLGFSVIVGAALGGLLAVVVLPSLELAVDLRETVPPTVLVVDPLTAIGGPAGVVLACLLAGRAAAWLGRRVDLLTELRLLA